MNTDELQRKAHILKLRLIVCVRWLAVEFEPASSPQFRTVAYQYGVARGELYGALLRERERQMNRRTF